MRKFMRSNFSVFVLAFALVLLSGAFGTAWADGISYIDADRSTQTRTNTPNSRAIQQHGQAGTSQAEQSASPNVSISTARHISFSQTARHSQSPKE